MCNGTFQHNFQPLEKETEIAINTVADPELQIGVCVCVCVCKVKLREGLLIRILVVAKLFP